MKNSDPHLKESFTKLYSQAINCTTDKRTAYCDAAIDLLYEYGIGELKGDCGTLQAAKIATKLIYNSEEKECVYREILCNFIASLPADE